MALSQTSAPSSCRSFRCLQFTEPSDSCYSVFFSVLIVVGVMGNIVQPLMNIGKAVAASGNYFDMLDAEPVSSGGLAGPEVSARGDIEFRDVSFSYPTRPGVQILKNFDAVFQAGKTTALVGPSGSGKSTIVALLEQWYDLQGHSNAADAPQVEAVEKEKVDDGDSSDEHIEIPNGGTIATGGNDISTFNRKWWRSQIGLVQQEPFLFNDTIEKNVAHGLIGTQWEGVSDVERLELVKEACIEAYADDFVSKLPKVWRCASRFDYLLTLYRAIQLWSEKGASS